MGIRFRVVVNFLLLAMSMEVVNGAGEPDRRSSSSLFMTERRSVAETSLEYDYYRERCPQAVKIIRSTMGRLYSGNPSLAPGLLRLLFHDCFVRGCDGSVLLGRVNGSLSEQDSEPNKTLKGLDAIDAIKSKLEDACPATVSCADTLVLAARDSVVLAGGPFYPLLTGRRDSERSFFNESSLLLPSPNNTYAQTLASFADQGFSDRDVVALLGAHSIGSVHCRFFSDRLFDFSGQGLPDGSMDEGMVAEMRAACGAPVFGGGPTVPLGSSRLDGGSYYQRLLDARGIMRADQELTAGRTVRWVRTYAMHEQAFRADFARAMMKLSGLHPLTGSMGQLRTRCSQLAP